jgi:hypothetical protein
MTEASITASVAISLLLSVLTFTSTFANCLDPFSVATEAFTTQDEAVVLSMEQMIESGWEGLATQQYETVLEESLDKMLALEVKSCYERWKSIVVMRYDLLITAQRYLRFGYPEGAEAIFSFMPTMDVMQQEAWDEALEDCIETSDCR